MKYPVLNSREWHAMSVKDKIISIILNAGYPIDALDMKRIEELTEEYDKPLE